MKVLFFGNNGWIGSKFSAYLEEYGVEVVASKCRADNETDVEKELLEHAPTHIVSFIGRTHGDGVNSVDYLEMYGKLPENIRDNLYAPMVLAILCKKHNIHFTYLGTGCIFSSIDPTQELFDDNTSPNFFGSSYSIVKGFTDRLMHMYPDVLNLRIRMPITAENHPRNFITKITQYDKICSIPNSMTVLEDMYPVILDMMLTKKVGTFNMCNRGVISHNEILEMYRDIIDPDFYWENFSLQEQDTVLKSKRSNNQLNVDKLYTLYPDIPDIQTSVRSCIMKMKK